MEGNKNKLILKREDDQRKILKFNIKVKTGKGVLFCTRKRGSKGIIWLDRMFYGKEGKPNLEFDDSEILVDADDEFELSDIDSEEEPETEVNEK